MATILALMPVSLCHAQGTQPPSSLPPGTVTIETQNTSFRLTNQVHLSVKRMSGYMIPEAGKIVSLDDKKSFSLQIVNAETRLSAHNLTALLNEYVLPHAGSPVHDVHLSFDGQTVLVKGYVKKGFDLPFTGTCVASVTPQGEIRLHFTDFQAAHIFKKGLLNALGIRLSAIAQPQHPSSSFHVEGDDVIVPVRALFPPPPITGKLASIHFEGDQLVQIFGEPDQPMSAPPVNTPNYIYFHQGTIRFGKLTMNDVELELIDQDASDPFDFSPDHYHLQIEAGYSKSLPNLGLLVYMPDYDTLLKKKH